MASSLAWSAAADRDGTGRLERVATAVTGAGASRTSVPVEGAVDAWSAAGTAGVGDGAVNSIDGSVIGMLLLRWIGLGGRAGRWIGRRRRGQVLARIARLETRDHRLERLVRGRVDDVDEAGGHRQLVVGHELREGLRVGRPEPVLAWPGRASPGRRPGTPPGGCRPESGRRRCASRRWSGPGT